TGVGHRLAGVQALVVRQRRALVAGGVGQLDVDGCLAAASELLGRQPVGRVVNAGERGAEGVLPHGPLAHGIIGIGQRQSKWFLHHGHAVHGIVGHGVGAMVVGRGQHVAVGIVGPGQYVGGAAVGPGLLGQPAVVVIGEVAAAAVAVGRGGLAASGI